MQRWFFADDQIVIKNPTTPESPSIIHRTSSPSSLPDTYWKFSVRCDWELCSNESLAICGSIPNLGKWNPNHCLPLNRENNSTCWFLTVLLPRKYDIYYRYLLCATNSSGQRIVRFWETHGNARLISRNQIQSLDDENCDIFGFHDNKFKVERGWINSYVTVVQFKFYQSPFVFKKSHCQPLLYVKVTPLKVKPHEQCEKLSTTDTLKSLEEFNAHNYLSTEFAFCEVASLQDKNREFHKQPNYGTPCDCSDSLIFNLTLGDFEQTAYLIELFNFPPKAVSDISAQHFGYQYVALQELKGSEGTLYLTIMCATKHRPIGSIKCDYLVVRPIASHDFNMAERCQRHWGTSKDCQHIGHRGCGRSFWFHNNILRENTIDSFKLASEHGADMLEFDVQLTKDGIPVLYHDFQLNIATQLDNNTEKYDVMQLPLTENEFASLKPFARNAEDGCLSIPLHKFALDQLKRVKVFEPAKEDKPRNPCKEPLKNNRPFVTLTKVLKQINPNLGFLIELKWPQKFKNGSTQGYFAQDFDKNDFVDVILSEVLKTSGTRHIIFTSYDADICTMIRLKQNRYPVFFMIHDTPLDAEYPFWDPRGSCIASGNHFAKAMQLFGIIANCSEILEMPGKVTATHELDLCLFLWGNTCRYDDTRKYLKTLGIDGIVFDRVNHALESVDLERNIFLLDCLEESEENNKDL